MEATITLSLAWIRSVGNTQELVFASDSRLRAGQAWDVAPKIFTLPRSDALISFAGATDYAYPLVVQMSQAIGFFPASRDRRNDISVAKGIALKVFNEMRENIHDLPRGQMTAGDPGVRFIFGGYQWRQKRFRIWELHYDASIDRFTFRPVQPWHGGNSGRVLAMIGDATDEARDRLVELLRSRGKLPGNGFDMEPFEVLRDMIRDRSHPAIGGAPQLGKVYSYMRSQLFAVAWPDATGVPHALGRAALGFERFDLPLLDPDAPHLHSRHAAAASDDDEEFVTTELADEPYEDD
ncbi:hypothetical protein [Leifsonia sp. NPDC058230]|uniref:hypothetical protein n=1 Tax=Leifsonia sp. NPDC058230 TaxID=3346391 RepID=UPI0036DB89E1